jgi:hypothetical protein
MKPTFLCSPSCPGKQITDRPYSGRCSVMQFSVRRCHGRGLFSANLNRRRTRGNLTGTSANPKCTALGLRQTAVVSRHPQMMPAVGKAWHRGLATKLRHGLVYVAERPAAFAVIEFE